MRVCGANVLWLDALPDANPTYSSTNEDFYNNNKFDNIDHNIIITMKQF